MIVFLAKKFCAQLYKLSCHRKNIQKRIKDLYLTREIPYESPTYITLLPDNTPVAVNDETLLFKTPEDGWGGHDVIGIKREDFVATADASDISIPVASAKDTVAKGTKPALRIYDLIGPGAYARAMFILYDSVIAVTEGFGSEIEKNKGD